MATAKTHTYPSTFRSTMRITRDSYTREQRSALMTLLEQRAPDADVFEEEGNEPFFWRALASNSEIDSHFSRMMESSLRNYAEDAKAGIQFQVSHSRTEVGWGRSLDGNLVGPKTKPRCEIDFYAIPGLRAGNISSDDFLRGMRAGIYADVSIGFIPGRFVCSICGGDMLRWWTEDGCSHFPGVKYPKEKGKGEELCIAQIEDSRLSEVSQVYDGSTPGAGNIGVEKARMVAAERGMGQRMHDLLEATYRIALPESRRVVALRGARAMENDEDTVIEGDEQDEQEPSGATVENNDAEPGGDEEEVTEDTVIEEEAEPASDAAQAGESTEDRLAAERERLKGHGIKIGRDPVLAVKRLGDALINARKKVTELAPLADIGETYHERLLEDLDAEVVRAFGSEGAEARKARYRKLVANASVEEIEATIRDLGGEAAKRFPGGRVTTDNAGTSLTEGDDETTSTIGKRRRDENTPGELVL